VRSSRGRSAFALEPSHYPDSVNNPSWPTTVLNPGEWYGGQIVYMFSVDKRK
jgi:aldose 1-epimerase